MPPRKDVDASTSVPAFYGAELRHKREAAGLTLDQLSKGKFYSIAYLSQIELGDRRMPYDLAVHADTVLDTDGFFERRCEDARKARLAGHAEYFVDAAAMEKNAEVIEEWAPLLVPGMLQTPAYAEALIRTVCPRTPEELVRTRVTARTSRVEMLTGESPMDFWVVMDEQILRRPLIEPTAMSEQLTRIVDIIRGARGVLQIVPYNAGLHPFLMGTARVMAFPDAPSAVYTEGMHHGQLIDDPGLVKEYSRSYDRLRSTALPPETSLAMVESAAKDLLR